MQPVTISSYSPVGGGVGRSDFLGQERKSPKVNDYFALGFNYVKFRYFVQAVNFIKV